MGLVRGILGVDEGRGSDRRGRSKSPGLITGLASRIADRRGRSADMGGKESEGTSTHPAQASERVPLNSSGFSSPQEVSQAFELVNAAVQDLEKAADMLAKPAGLISGVKAMGSAAMGTEDATWKDAGKTFAYDARIDAKKLVLSAYGKYEAAAELVDGLPIIEIAEIKPGKIKEAADQVGGAMGETAAKMLDAAVSIVNFAVIHSPFGLIKVAVKKGRTKKAVNGVDGMLIEVEKARSMLWEAQQAGQGARRWEGPVER